MKGTTILLLGAATLVAYVSAHPYSKYPEGGSLPEEYHFAKKSSNSNSNSYSQSNHDETDVNGAYHGQTFSGSKSSGFSTSGGSHSQSSSYSSSSLNGNVPLNVYGLPSVPQNSNNYGESSLALGNPGTAGLGLSSNDFSGSQLSSYGADQITEGEQSSDLSGSPAPGLEGIESGFKTGVKDGSTSSNSGIFGPFNGATIGQVITSIPSSFPKPGSGYFGQVGSLPGAGFLPSVGSLPGAGFLPSAGSLPGAVQYWWNGPNSPFASIGKPSGGCNSNACSLSGNFDLTEGSGGAHAANDVGQVGLNIHGGNPFLSQGQAGSDSGFITSGASIGQSKVEAGSGSGSGSGLNSHPIDVSKNPFLSGSHSSGTAGSTANAGSNSFAYSNAGSGASSSGSGASGSSASSGTFTGAGNPFLKPDSGSGKIPSGQAPIAGSGSASSGSVGTGAGSLNPFFKPGSGSVVITPPVAISSDQSNQGFPYPSPTPGFPIQSTIIGSLIPVQPTPGFPSLNSNSDSGDSTSDYFGSSGSFATGGNGDFQSQEGQFLSFPTQSTIVSEISADDFQNQEGQFQSFPGLSTIVPGGFSVGYPTPSTLIPEQKPSEFDNGLSLSCTGQGRICVQKNLCVNGRFSGNGQGLTQVRNGPQICKLGREVCCTLDEYQSGSSTNFGSSQNSGFASSESSAGSNSGATGNYGGFSGSSNKPSGSGNFGQSTGSTGTQGQSGQFGSTNNYGQSGSYDQSNSGSFGQNDESDSDRQSQQKESFNFGAQSSSHASADSNSNFGNQQESGFNQGFPSGSPAGTPAPTLNIVSLGFGYKKPTLSGSTGASANSNAEASSQAGSNSGISGTYVHPSPTPSNGDIFVAFKKPSQSSGGLFGSSDNSGEDLSSGEPQFISNPRFPGIKGSAESNGYLPPIGSEPSSNVPAFSKPPEEEGGPSDVVIDKRPPPPRPFVPAPVTVQVGCAAALICVEEKFCTLEGVISPEPVALTSQQIERRAPLSSCKNPENGVIGKCCRDPNYVDPWPTGNLPANYSGGFDEQGFPTFLNIAKTRPPTKKQPPATKGGFRQATKDSDETSRPDSTNPLEFFTNQFMNFPNTVQQWQANLTAGLPPLPDFITLPTLPTTFPSLPQFGSQFGAHTKSTASAPSKTVESGSYAGTNKPSYDSNPQEQPTGSKSYDLSATNQSPTIIAPHTPGAQCGLRNKVQRPSGLDKDDVAFGEIPWQAMVLSTKDRKLLCSGVIVAPNAVLTAAHCVEGFKTDEVSIKSGEWKLGYELKHEEPLPFEIVKVTSIVPHPGYRQGSPSHDFAILFLQHSLTLDQHVDTICLGDIPQPKPGRNCIATGWGKIVLQVNAAGALMHSIDVDLVPQNECRQRLQGAESQIEVDNTLTCVKAQKQRNNMCQVDVGGPLACDRGDGFYELTGIYSKDTGCLPTNQVATFALIDTNWVKQSLSSPPQVPIPSNEVDVPHLGESPSSSNVQPNFGAQVKQPETKCECQQSHLPPELNQYLPPTV